MGILLEKDSRRKEKYTFKEIIKKVFLKRKEDIL